jgi:hypothetical protein
VSKNRRKNRKLAVQSRPRNSQPAPTPTAPAVPAPLPQTAQEPSPQQAPAKAWWKPESPQDVVKWAIAFIVLMLGTIGGFYFGMRNSANSQRADDRASGKLKAKFEFVGIGNTDEKTLAELTKKTKLDFPAVYLDDVDRLVRWAPYVQVKNTGEEVIDGIQVVMDFMIGGVMGKGVTQITPQPYVVTQPTILLPTMSAKLMPGQTARIPLLKPLVEQIRGTGRTPYPEQEECFGAFRVSVYCRMFNSPAYDAPDKLKATTLYFAWLRSGFEGEQAKKILETQPRVRIDGD